MLDAYRSSLTPMLVETLISAQDWLRGSPRFDGIEKDLVKLRKVDWVINFIYMIVLFISTLFLLGKLDRS